MMNPEQCQRYSRHLILAEVRFWEGKTIVVYCQGGMRSLKAATLLKENGIERIINLEGGVMQWQQEVDSS